MARVVRLLAQCIGFAATVLVSLELTVRFDDWSQFDVPLLARPIGLDDLAVRDSLGLHARPSTQFRQFRINSLGFRGAEVDLKSKRGTLVVASGASETFGLYEKNGGEWPRQMEDSLRACGADVTVLNAAFAGMSLPTVEQDFMLRLKSMNPAVVVYYPTPMQYLSTLPLRATPPSTEPPRDLPVLRSRALPRFRDALKRAVPDPVLNALRGLLLQRSRGASGTVPAQQVEGFRVAAFESDLRRLIGIYRAAGVTPVLVIHRNRFAEMQSQEARMWLRAWERFYPRYTGEAIVRFDSAAALRVLAVGTDSAVTVVDPLDGLRSIGSAAFSDYSHLTSNGAAIVGGLAARALRGALCGGAKR